MVMGKSVNWTNDDLIALCALGLFGIALYHSRRLKSQGDLLPAGRSMRRWPIAVTMYMAVFSTNTFLGSTGWVSRPRSIFWIGVQTFGIILAVPPVVTLYPALFFRLRITSAYEYLDRCFGRRKQGKQK